MVIRAACRTRRAWLRQAGAALLAVAGLAPVMAAGIEPPGSTSAPAVAAGASAAASAPGGGERWPVARDTGRLRASQLGLVVNLDDAYSVAVGQVYQQQRGLSEGQVLRLHLPVRAKLEPGELLALRQRIDSHFGPGIQALALAWRQPWAVGCMSITAAVTLGWQPTACQQTCGRTAASAYFNHPTAMPFSSLGLRPSMLLAAADEAQAQRLIARGVASDATLGRLFGQRAEAVFVRTTDAARNVREPLFPPMDQIATKGVQVRRVEAAALARGPAPERVVLMQTGVARLTGQGQIGFLPGALADHLTSFGGVLDGSSGQSSVLEWLEAGATASYGTVSEPCNHLQKFPHPTLLLLHYLQGVTALEAYWKSVAWPAQGLFVGEPLAAPFAPR